MQSTSHNRELTVSDSPKMQDFFKVVLWCSLTWVGNEYEFLFPTHKGDTMFKGNQVHIVKIIGALTLIPSCLTMSTCVTGSSHFILSSGSVPMACRQLVHGFLITSVPSALLKLQGSLCVQVVPLVSSFERQVVGPQMHLRDTYERMLLFCMCLSWADPSIIHMDLDFLPFSEQTGFTFYFHLSFLPIPRIVLDCTHANICFLCFWYLFTYNWHVTSDSAHTNISTSHHLSSS